MKTFKRILVAMDCSFMDEKILSYLSFLCNAIQPKSIYFFHAEKNLAGIQVLRSKFEKEFESVVPVDEQLKSQMEKSVHRYLGEMEGVSYEFDVVEGSPFDQIMHWADVKEVDLVIMGKKDVGKGSGIVSKKIARNINCSVMFIPENAVNKIDQIVLPIDFSEYSEVAFETAVSIADNYEEVKLLCVNVYDIPTAHYKILRTFGQFQSVMEENAKEAFQAFLKRVHDGNQQVEPVFIANEEYDVAIHINRFAKNLNNSLIIIGARGHSKLELVFLGSVTEKLLVYHDKSPILVIKN